MRLKTLFSLLILLSFFNGVCCAEEKGPCRGSTISVVVDTRPHKLWLCEHEKIIKEFNISLGRGGVDKRKKGDNKTPLGEYPLGIPRPSNKFGIFIPIDYPTEKQREKGCTGSDVGIHGPYRLFKWFGRITTSFDWTQGCIAVGSDDDIAEIALWIKQKQARKIRIE